MIRKTHWTDSLLNRTAAALRMEAGAAPPGEKQRLEALAGVLEAELRYRGARITLPTGGKPAGVVL